MVDPVHIPPRHPRQAHRSPRPVLRMVAGGLLLAGCAGSGALRAHPLQGRAGPVAWEVINMGQVVSADDRRVRWSYTIVLENTTASPIEFERVESGMYRPGDVVGGAASTLPFQRRLDPHGRLNLPYTDSFGWSTSAPLTLGTATLLAITVDRRFIGKDAQGHPVIVPVQIVLDRGLGKRAARPTPLGPLPPPQAIDPARLGTLAGTWQGYYNDGTFDVPVAVTITDAGAFEAAENDPVTNRFRGTLRIEDGHVVYVQGGDTGQLTLYELGANRLLLLGDASRKLSSGMRQSTWEICEPHS